MRLRSLYRTLRRTHPALVLATLDTIGLIVASYLSVVELGNGVPYCGVLRGCDQVAESPYSRLFGVPVAVFGVGLSMTLLVLALAWWRRGGVQLLLAHYALSLVGVIFEIRIHLPPGRSHRGSVRLVRHVRALARRAVRHRPLGVGAPRPLRARLGVRAGRLTGGLPSHQSTPRRAPGCRTLP